jgi:hypothetical protein
MKNILLVTCLSTFIHCSTTLCYAAPVFVDSSFENYSIPDGSYAAPAGSWEFRQNSFVVDPFIPHTHSGSSNTRSATYVPHLGDQYVSTYAGNGGLSQSLQFTLAGMYQVSVYAASPSGSIFIQTPVFSGTETLVSGEFQFSLSTSNSTVNATYFGGTQTTTAGGPWLQHSAVITVPSPGTYWIGARNLKFAVYFIYYDDFQIVSVPEPSSILLALPLLAMCAYQVRCRRCSAHKNSYRLKLR